MKIGVTSQNFRTITGHAGKTRRFLIFDVGNDGDVAENGRLDLPKEMSMHEFRGGDHPLDALDVLITGGCGEGFAKKMARRGVRLITTSEQDPLRAADAAAHNIPLPEPLPHNHHTAQITQR